MGGVSRVWVRVLWVALVTLAALGVPVAVVVVEPGSSPVEATHRTYYTHKTGWSRTVDGPCIEWRVVPVAGVTVCVEYEQITQTDTKSCARYTPGNTGDCGHTNVGWTYTGHWDCC